MNTAIINYQEALELYSAIILHTTDREAYPMWDYMNTAQRTLILESTIAALLNEEEYEKISDLQEELEKL